VDDWPPPCPPCLDQWQALIRDTDETLLGASAIDWNLVDLRDNTATVFSDPSFQVLTEDLSGFSSRDFSISWFAPGSQLVNAFGTIDSLVVPEPQPGMLLAAGLAAIAASGRKRRLQ